MSKILIEPSQNVTCPHCNKEFVLKDGISSQVMQRYEEDHLKWQKSFEDELRKNAERIIAARFEDQYRGDIEGLRVQVESEKRRLKDAAETRILEEQRIRAELGQQAERDRAELARKIKEELGAEQARLKSELDEKQKKISEFTEMEFKLRDEKRRLEEDKKEFDLKLRRSLDEASKRIEGTVRQEESERFGLKEAELRKKIEDAQKANQDLQRKLEQGSQQLQGEILELEVESRLKQAFPLDIVEPVKKGVRGADVAQRVMSKTGQLCGKLLWEVKRAENWSKDWIPKLKEDQQEAQAAIAILVTTNMRKDLNGSIAYVDGVWIIKPDLVCPMADILRRQLIEINEIKVANTGKGEKMELLYNYLNSQQFVQHVRAVVDAFAEMKKDVDAEKRAMAKIWKKRETEIEIVTTNMINMCGELQGIAQMPQLKVVAPLGELAANVVPESANLGSEASGKAE